MTTRKFTPPTVFPTEYVTRDGRKAVVVAKLNSGRLVVVVDYDSGEQSAMYFNPCGAFNPNFDGPLDLHDLPKRIVTWHNGTPNHIGWGYKSLSNALGIDVDDRICVYRIERDEDGGNPTITVEQ